MLTAYYRNNSHYLKLSGLAHVKTPTTYVNDATVTVTIFDETGTEVTGAVWPLTMTYVPLSDGDYEVDITSALNLDTHKCGTVQITATKGVQFHAQWDEPVEFKKRPLPT